MRTVVCLLSVGKMTESTNILVFDKNNLLIRWSPAAAVIVRKQGMQKLFHMYHVLLSVVTYKFGWIGIYKGCTAVAACMKYMYEAEIAD